MDGSTDEGNIEHELVVILTCVKDDAYVDDPSEITGGTQTTALGEGSCIEDWHLTFVIPELRTFCKML